jgi:hypothetical protein
VGKKSMGAFLENEGFGALPGPAFPPPGLFNMIFKLFFCGLIINR